MKYTINKLKIILFFIAPFFIGCNEEEEYRFGEIVSPTNVTITAEITGADETNPNGDGTGEVKYTVNAENAITYKFIHEGSETMAPGGTHTYTFGTTGLNSYVVTAVAIGTAGTSSSSTVVTDVLVNYQAPADLLNDLHGDSSKTWRIKAEEAGHFGLGPGTGTWPEWYSALANAKDGFGMYDDRFTFNADGTYNHVTNGDVLGKSEYLFPVFGDSGQSPDANDDIENYPLSDYNANWQLSAPGGVETITFDNNGFTGGFYIGTNKYEIIERSSDRMYLRTLDSYSRYWYFVLITDD